MWLDVPRCDEVERHVDAARLRGHSPDVLVDRLLVQGVDRGPLGRPAGGREVLRDRVKLLRRASHERDLRPPRAKVRATTPPSYAAAVDDRGVATQELRQVRFLCFVFADVL